MVFVASGGLSPLRHFQVVLAPAILTPSEIKETNYIESRLL